MRRRIFLAAGVLFVAVGVVWSLQGLDLLGQSGGMNGHPVWVVIGSIIVIGGLALAVIGIRAGPRR